MVGGRGFVVACGLLRLGKVKILKNWRTKNYKMGSGAWRGASGEWGGREKEGGTTQVVFFASNNRFKTETQNSKLPHSFVLSLTVSNDSLTVQSEKQAKQALFNKRRLMSQLILNDSRQAIRKPSDVEEGNGKNAIRIGKEYQVSTLPEPKWSVYDSVR